MDLRTYLSPWSNALHRFDSLMAFSLITLRNSVTHIPPRSSLTIEALLACHYQQRLQAKWKGHKAYKSYKQHKRAAIDLQCSWRSKVAKGELKKLKQAARETGALKEAKDKLEKRVEELTLLLDLERQMRNDLEGSQIQEISKLESKIEKLHIQVEETNAILTKERQEAKASLEQAHGVIKEVPVVDTAMVDQLTKENEELKSALDSLQTKVDEVEKMYADAMKDSEEKSKILEEQDAKIEQLQESLQSSRITRLIWNPRTKYYVSRLWLCQLHLIFLRKSKESKKRLWN